MDSSTPILVQMKFNFHRYIKRSLEDDFKVVVGISIPLWFFALLFMLANVYGLYTYSWLSLAQAPLVVTYTSHDGHKTRISHNGDGTRNQNSKSCNKVSDHRPAKQQVLLVQSTPVDSLIDPFHSLPERIPGGLFPIMINLILIFSSVMVLFLIATMQYEFGITSCFHENLPLILTRVFLGVALQILCSYITFPLYALVI